MMRPGTFVVLWGLLVVLFGGMWMRVVPPGGVSWPFFALAVAIPAGAVVARRRGALAWQLVLYALVTGFYFAAGLVFDGREDLRIRFGQDTDLGLWSRFAGVATAMWIASALAVVVCARGSRGHNRPTGGEQDQGM
jgi:uncharacterized membrane protein YhaH (DUF805 family)